MATAAAALIEPSPPATPMARHPSADEPLEHGDEVVALVHLDDVGLGQAGAQRLGG